MRYILSLSKLLSGWRLFVFLSIIPLVMAAEIAIFDPSANGVRNLVLTSTCYTFVIFCLIFSSSSLQSLWPNELFRWLLRNRRFMGLSFAASQSVHVLAVVVFALVAPITYAAESTLFSQFLGLVGYLFALAMAATSFSPTRTWLGPARWQLLHRTGGYSIWIAFTYIFGKRLVKHPSVPLYIITVSLLLFCLVLRLFARKFGRQGSPDLHWTRFLVENEHGATKATPLSINSYSGDAK
jgi:sulfoxide reductase heme-binding subunit YedZ